MSLNERIWARGGKADRTDDAAADAALLGIDLGPPPGPDGDMDAGFDGLWPDNIAALEAFLALCGQWRVAARADGGLRPLALDYGAAPAAFDLAGLTVDPGTWLDVRLIEQGALEAMNGD